MDIQLYRIIAVGDKTPDILFKIINELSQHSYEIDTISSLRLGHSTIVVCLVDAIHDKTSIRNCLQNIVDKYQLELIIDNCSSKKFKFIKSDAFMRIKGNHVTGIKAYIISELINSGLDIHGLESNNYHKDGENRFVINIKGQAMNGIENLSAAADKLHQQDLDVAVANSWQLLI